KVTGIQPYGAFVALDNNTQGLVHISEITHGFVKDIHDYLSVGDEVNVKILHIDEANNKYNLPIRATENLPKKRDKLNCLTNNKYRLSIRATEKPPKKSDSSKRLNKQKTETGFNTLKDKLEEWIQQSEERKKTFKQ